MTARRWRAWGAASLGALALVAAAGFGAPALAPLGVGLVVAPLLSLGAVEVARRGLRVARVVEPPYLTAGEGALVRVVLRGWPVRAGLVGALERTVDHGVPGAAGPLTRAGRRGHPPGHLEVGWALAPARRGEHVLTPPRVVLSDPFGMVQRAAMSRGGATTLFVAPRTVPVGIPWGIGADGGAMEGTGRRRLSAGLDLDGVRDYLPGDPLSRVHWGQTARRGRLQTKDMHAASAGGRPTVVLLDCHSDDGADPEVFETAVVAAASLARHLLTGGHSVALVHTGAAPRVAPSARWEELERVLAAVARDGDTPLGAALERLSARRPRPPAVLVVTARADSDLPRSVRVASESRVRVDCVLCGAAAAMAPELETSGAGVIVAAGVDGLAVALRGGRGRARR